MSGTPARQVTRARTPSEAAEAFRARLAELGATLLERAWLGARTPHRVRCAAGHECAPRPDGVSRGRGICRTCGRRDPAAAEATFRAALAELGAALLEPAWLGSRAPHRVRCAEGHMCWPRPDDVRRGGGLCRTCAGKDPAAAEAAFRTRLRKLGAELLEPVWLGVDTPHRVRCATGHECFPHPGNVQQGRGICRTCAGNDPAVAESAFRARLAELGAELLEPVWLGSLNPHRVRCAQGHETGPRPAGVIRGLGICRACIGTDPATAAAAFRRMLAEQGATLLEPLWLGNGKPHQAICAAGHNCQPIPSNVQQGGGICRFCAGKVWDVFYTVADQDKRRIKFGITSGNPRPRMSEHRRNGYREIVRMITELRGTTAQEMERAARAALTLAGIYPLQGREYYDIAALPVVLDVADNYLGG